MNAVPTDLIHSLFGKPCCRKRTNGITDLNLGFGEKCFHFNNKLTDSFYGEWEIGTFTSVWRISQNSRVILASLDASRSGIILDEALQSIEIGYVDELEITSTNDILVKCNDGITIDFLRTFSDDDESFHIFCPNKKVATYEASCGWTVGLSNHPWRSAGENAEGGGSGIRL